MHKPLIWDDLSHRKNRIQQDSPSGFAGISAWLSSFQRHGPCRLLLQYTSRICLSSVDEADLFIEMKNGRMGKNGLNVPKADGPKFLDLISSDIYKKFLDL